MSKSSTETAREASLSGDADPRIPKSRSQRRAELAGLSQEEKDSLSEAAQARVHKQVSSSRARAKKLGEQAKARKAAWVERGYRDEPEGGDGDGE